MGEGAARYSIGISGWEHEVLDQCFYPRTGAGPSEKLKFYARYFNAVEVRSSFWDETLNAADAREWNSAVGGTGEFLFIVKLHSSFTHNMVIAPRVTRNVRALLQELDRHNRLGALLIHLPYSFTNTSANRYHLEKLGAIFGSYPTHVEFRHDTWNQPGLEEFLSENALSSVSSDLPHLKHYIPFSPLVLGDTAYVRLHGRNEKGWLLNGVDTRYDYLYNSRELKEILRRCNALSRRCKRMIVICNNTTMGKAIVNALQLRAALRDGKRVDVPLATLDAFPHLHNIAQKEGADASLFGGGEYREAM